MSNKVNRAVDRLVEQQSDFRSVATRRAEGALKEIQSHVSALYESLQAARDKGWFSLEPVDIDGYSYHVSAIDEMVGRLKRPS